MHWTIIYTSHPKLLRIFDDLLRFIFLEANLFNGVHANGKGARPHPTGKSPMDAFKIALVGFARQADNTRLDHSHNDLPRPIGRGYRPEFFSGSTALEIYPRHFGQRYKTLLAAFKKI